MNGYVSIIAAKIAAISPEVKLKIFSLTTGWGIWVAYNWWFDNVLYPAVIAYWGIRMGGTVMFIAAMLNNLAWLFVYEYKKMEWVGGSQEAIGSMFGWTRKNIAREYKHVFVKCLVQVILAIPYAVFAVAMWCIGKGGIRAFLALSMFTDSFVVTAFLRKGSPSGLKARDMGIFFASTVVSCAYWTLRSWSLVIIIKFIIATLQCAQKLFF